MTPINNNQMSEQKILRAFDKVLEPLYLELEASEAENLHCEIAKVAQTLISHERAEAVEEYKKMNGGARLSVSSDEEYLQSIKDKERGK